MSTAVADKRFASSPAATAADFSQPAGQRATTGRRSRRPDRAFPLEETEAALRTPREDPEAIKPMVVPGR
jgi:hypothetical protein